MALLVISSSATGAVVKLPNTCDPEGAFRYLESKFGKCAFDPPAIQSSDGMTLMPSVRPPLIPGEYVYPVQPPEEKPPSAYDYKLVREKQEGPDPEFLAFMPATACPPLPLQLLHPAFANFQDALGSDLVPTRQDCEHYANLAAACSAFYDSEQDLTARLWGIWNSYLGDVIMDEIYTGPSGLVVREFRYDALFFLLEGRLGMSTARSEPLFHALRIVACNWRGSNSELFLDTCYPALVLEQVGPMLQVGAVAILPCVTNVRQDKLCYQHLASVQLAPIHNHNYNMAVQGAKACMAIKAAVKELSEYYRRVGDDNVRGGPLLAVRELYRRRIPAPLHAEIVDSNGSVRQLGAKLVYVLDARGGGRCIVKYCQRYGASVHEAWARAGLAPKLLQWKTIRGGWIEVRMEYLAEDEGWLLLADRSDADDLREQVVAAMEAAHAVEVGTAADGEATYGAHGDMRDANVMVRSRGPKLEVRFIDFDWSAEEGLPNSCYPMFMNHAELNWPRGAEEGKPLQRSLDVKLLKLSKDTQYKRSDNPKAP